MDNDTNEPTSFAIATHLEDSFTETRRGRHDGWNGERMADFIRTLAETGVVADACRACDMSAKSAYALRYRDNLFARLWEAALAMARHRLADELLARSLKGSAEQIVRDGCIWGERHHFDNKLAFAILRRLDRRAELGSTFKTPPAWEMPAPAPAVSGSWQPLLDAVAEDRKADAEALLEAPKGDKGNTEGNDPPFSLDLDEDEDDTQPYKSRRVWQKWDTGEWRTDYPPPPGFDGDEKGNWEDSSGYSRSLAPDELAALAAAGLAEEVEEPINEYDDAAERDLYFATLAAAKTPQGQD
jgi:hypothetical protein